MQVEFLAKFSKDLDKINNKAVKLDILKLIEQLEVISTISEISNLKKLTGYKSAYRIRVGDYRIGIFVDKDAIQLARVLHRKDIYKIFP
jgi:mRNA interferase RelE/StbE